VNLSTKTEKCHRTTLQNANLFQLIEVISFSQKWIVWKTADGYMLYDKQIEFQISSITGTALTLFWSSERQHSVWWMMHTLCWHSINTCLS